MKKDITIKQITQLDEVKQVQQIEQLVWQMNPIPFHQTYTAVNNGGILIGAYGGDEIIGFLYSFPGFKGGDIYLCSHMLGIHPDYRTGGLGAKMKELQKDIALQMGYKLIIWTFDPLESVNTYLNLHKLGGIGGRYIENHYGKMNDVLNAGLPTDRFLVEWWIDSEHVAEPRDKSEKTNLPTDAIEYTDKGFPVIADTFDPTAGAIVPIPTQYQEIKKEDLQLAIDWRYKTRKWIQQLMADGYVAVDLTPNPEEKISLYHFEKRNTLSL
ncbi:GNAT family N-acetyltransferase [Aquibacillus sp. 3ASR75-11]|uniref:GNAT family N-acetyltransferase n=1 Tax=Terrihalobacillus insolitus TaxID=2950438 RepID=A0A9X3WUI7_9BACI|nr:GNAT family N-acetyltransferase [Terrihalobacillus insolitus]MDC3413777.1 GNAT family N-acetyltransferase [Terrihalobacillus insolitus]MDC3425945.1 GNAT family N-acetyltransferase [Terrihalobacillus insolitus]